MQYVQDTQNIVFTKTSTTDVQADVKTNGNTIDKIMNGDTLLDSHEDYSVSNSTITFKARYLDTLSAGDYNLSVYYNPMGVTYAEATDNEAPKTTSITLTVNKEEQTISNVTEMTKTYGEAPFKIIPTAHDTPKFTFESNNPAKNPRQNLNKGLHWFSSTSPNMGADYRLDIRVLIVTVQPSTHERGGLYAPSPKNPRNNSSC